VRSKPLEEIKKEAQALADNGFEEIVLVGINLSSYGQDSGHTFPEAVKAVNDIKGIERVRLGSLEPEMINDKDINRMAAQKKLCPQFHLSLQSGCDRTLKSMNRRYTSDEYRILVDKLRAAFENCAITTDVMVGFPGETDEDFNKSAEFIEGIGFSKVHVFPYSPRKGTPAAEMTDQIPNSGEKNYTDYNVFFANNQTIMIDIGEEKIINSFKYLPPQESSEGVITHYTLSISSDLSKWTDVATGEFSNIKNNPIWQHIKFEPIKGKVLRLEAKKIAEGERASFADLKVLTENL
jgi:threonylcarbamoyladenosine tRNA methylthiotransferase MtaB